jgi:hypothetical protein
MLGSNDAASPQARHFYPAESKKDSLSLGPFYRLQAIVCNGL